MQSDLVLAEAIAAVSSRSGGGACAAAAATVPVPDDRDGSPCLDAPDAERTDTYSNFSHVTMGMLDVRFMAGRLRDGCAPLIAIRTGSSGFGPSELLD
jgi:hypothetical protein